MNDYYADLGVPRDANPEDIKRAYRRLARKLHPDVNPGAEAEAEFKKVSQAYDVLGDADKRRAYDMGQDPYGGAAGGFGQGFSFSDIMDAFFGGAAGAQRGPRPRRQRGQDALVALQIDLKTAIFGGQQELTVDTALVCETCHGEGCQPGTSVRQCDVCHGRGEVQQVQRSFLGQVMTSRPCTACQGFGTVITSPCFECSGHGRVRTRRPVAFKVPPGVDSGTRIHLAGKGEVGPGGGPAGDLFVEIRVTPHEAFTRRGDDLHCTTELPMTAAALGTRISLETFDGTQDVDIAPGVQPGEVITLRGQGVTHLRGAGRGDLVIHLDIRTPTRLTGEQEETLRQFARMRGEEQPTGRLASVKEGSFFGRVRDAFLGK